MPREISIRKRLLVPILRTPLQLAIPASLLCLLVSYSPAFAQGAPDNNHASRTATPAETPLTSSPGQNSMRTSSVNAAIRPLVSFQDGQLTINANNASLAEIMSALRACTGADIDIPINAAAERVTAQLGPGPSRKVLSDLLGWSSFDYIIQGSDEDPLAVQSVTLLVRVKGPASASQPSSVIATTRATRPPADVPAAQTENEPIAAGVVESATPEVPPDRPDAIQEKLGNGSDLQSRIAASGSNTAAGPSPNTSIGQSPAEMIQQLQQMYQQRRVLQQQQNQATGQRSP
jgi:hypothetical protein